MKIIYDARCLEYKRAGHPESPERVRTSYQFLKDKKLDFIQPEEYQEELITQVHTLELLARIKNGNFYDPDTPKFENIFFFARLSVAGALTAYQVAIKEGFAFSLLRPPGHHAGKSFLGGFCYLNNIAIAVQKGFNDGIRKIAILDIDAHHGNGTEDIFLGSKKVLYVSLHQHPLYPGTGLKSHNNCLNFPLPPGCGGKLYLEKLTEALEKIKEFQPQLIAISAGFDTYRDDPLTGFMLDISDYQEIGRLIRKYFPKKAIFAVLEGGYSLKLGELLYSFLKAIALS